MCELSPGGGRGVGGAQIPGSRGEAAVGLWVGG